LWPINDGYIQKPGGIINDINLIYYVPQKPYNVTVIIYYKIKGTLRDQIIYPEKNVKNVSDDYLRKLL
jgi:ABC-type uncharacterized transport system fused permease/ATPase subunit